MNTKQTLRKLALAACLLHGCCVSAQSLYADVNGDGTVDISDVNAVINAVLGKTNSEPIPDESEETYVSGQTRTFTVNGVSFKMVEVEGGTFTMGATQEQGSDAAMNEFPTHQVTLNNYMIGQTEVTQELWCAVLYSNPSYFTTGSLMRPVERVSYYDCVIFLAQLNYLTGMNFRFPTEAEWEYAARGGNKSSGYKYAGSNNVDDVAWYKTNSYDVGTNDNNYGTHIVATKSPNELGLYDMSGNVDEWCQDYYDARYYLNSPSDNPIAVSGSSKVTRGGNWVSSAVSCRVSSRGARDFGISYSGGLRLAL